MQELEYKEKLRQLQDDFDMSKKRLMAEYAKSQAKFSIGDIIKDNRVALKVDKIVASIDIFGMPIPVYCGPELKKNLTPMKSGNRVIIYGNNKAELIKKND